MPPGWRNPEKFTVEADKNTPLKKLDEIFSLYRSFPVSKCKQYALLSLIDATEWEELEKTFFPIT